MKPTLIAVLCATLLSGVSVKAQLWKEYADSAKVFSEKKENAKALEYYLKSNEELLKDSSQTFTLAKNQHVIGLIFYNNRQYDKAESYYLKAHQIIENIFGREHPVYAKISIDLGQLYRDYLQYDNAEKYYLESLQIRKKIYGKEHSDYVVSCNELGNFYRRIGKYEDAEKMHLEALQLREKLYGKEHPDYASSCNNLGNLYENMGLYEKSEKLLLEAKQVREKILGKNHRNYAQTCNNLAILYRNLGEYEKAEALLLEALQVREKDLGRDHPEFASSCNNLAILYRDLRQYDKAETFLLEALRIREKTLGKDHPDYAASCSNLAVLYVDLRQYDKAEALLLEALQIREKVLGRDHPEFASSCLNLGYLYIETFQYKKAEYHISGAKHIWEKVFGKNHLYYGIGCSGLGALYKESGQYESAEVQLLEAKQTWEKLIGKDHLYYTSTCINLANLYWRMEEPIKSHLHFIELFKSDKEHLKRIFGFTSENEKLIYLSKRYDNGWNYLSFLTHLPQIEETEFAYEMLLWNRNLILTSSKQLRYSIYDSNDSSLISKYNQWVEKKDQLAYWLSKPIAERQKRDSLFETDANIIEKELIRLSIDFRKQQQKEVSLKGLQGDLKNNEVAIEFTSFTYYDGLRWTDSTYYIALLLRKDHPEPELVYLFEQKQLDSILNYKGTSAGAHWINNIYSAKKPTSKSIYDLVWKPLESRLDGIKTIYYASSGSLHKVALAALPVNKTQFLSDKYKLVQLNTTASITDKSVYRVNSADKIVMYGAVQYDADSVSISEAAHKNYKYDIASRSLPEDLSRDGVPEFFYLKGAEKEIIDIGKLAATKKFNFSKATGLQATEESFKSLTGKNSPVVLHIATHGFFFPDPKNKKKDDWLGGSVAFRQSDNPLIRSGLALAGANNAWKGKPVKGVEDGILTAYEVSNMYLPNTKLAVLSACETGLGDIQGSEGVYGLQRAFKIAGVENLVMSLWKVPDQETAEFMQEFYKNLFARQTIQDAFYSAQTMMKNKYRNDPYKWAAWVLIR